MVLRLPVPSSDRGKEGARVRSHLSGTISLVPFSFDRFEAFENVTETTKKSLVQPVFVQEDLVHRPPTSALGVQDLLRAGLLHGLLLQPLLQ